MDYLFWPGIALAVVAWIAAAIGTTKLLVFSDSSQWSRNKPGDFELAFRVLVAMMLIWPVGLLVAVMILFVDHVILPKS